MSPIENVLYQIAGYCYFVTSLVTLWTCYSVILRDEKIVSFSDEPRIILSQMKFLTQIYIFSPILLSTIAVVWIEKTFGLVKPWVVYLSFLYQIIMLIAMGGFALKIAQSTAARVLIGIGIILPTLGVGLSLAHIDGRFLVAILVILSAWVGAINVLILLALAAHRHQSHRDEQV
jgi:hypothetical protein